MIFKDGKTKMGETLPFEKEVVKEYLDELIKYWRRKRDEQLNYTEKNKDEVYQNKEFERLPGEVLIPVCYIDAYQSIRISLFGEILDQNVS